MVMIKEKLSDEYYDEGEDGVLYNFPTVLANPDWRQRKEIEFMRTISRGVMLVTGEPRSGKDLWGVSLSFLNKLYFGRRVLLDFKPKRLFDSIFPEYEYIDPRELLNEASKMAKLAGVRTSDNNEDSDSFDTSKDKALGDAAKEWVESQQTQVLLKGAVLYLSELKRYCYNRNPHNPVNKLVGAICSIWGHLDLLLIGTHVFAHEIDQYSFKNYVKHWAKCSWSLTKPDTTEVKLTRGTFLTDSGMFDVRRPPIMLYVNGRKPREYLDGKGFFDLWNTKNFVNLKPTVRKEM